MEKNAVTPETANIAKTNARRDNRLGSYVKKELSRQPEKKKLTLAQKAKRGLICFFAAMLLLTAVSRAANEALVAKVSVKSVSGGILDCSVSASGVWAAESAISQRPEFTGLRLAEIYVSAGDTVDVGDALYAYDAEAVEEARRAISDKIAQYELQIKELGTARGGTADSAKLTLSQAERDLESAKNALDGAYSKIAADKQRAYEEALFAYQKETTLCSSQLDAAQQTLDAAQAAVNLSDPATQKAFDEAVAAHKALVAQWEYTLSSPRRALEKAQDEWTRVQNGTFDYTAELASYRTAVESAERAVETARQSYEQARKSDGAQSENIACQIESVELYMKVEQEKYDALTSLLERDCVVYSDVKGIVTSISAKADELSTDVAVAAISTEGLTLTAKLSVEQAKAIAVGDAVTLYANGKAQKEKLAVSAIGAPDSESLCTIVCTGGEGTAKTIGAAQEFVIEKKTEKQDARIPIQALREDGNGKYFVLIIGTENTVLGEKAIALRVDVTLIDHDEQYAAVDGALSAQDKLIVSSNKSIAAGDRVVIADA